jgi:C-terminal processing protease CtpA/Prc
MTTPDDLNPVLDTWDDSFRDRRKEIVGAVDLASRHPGLAPGHTGGFYQLRETDENDQPVAEGFIKPAGKRYTGRVFVLVNADNSSATFSFARIVQKNRLATLVGQPTGGNQRGINGGAYFFVRLPKSRVEIDLPQIGYFPKLGLTEPRPDAGVTPDVLVAVQPADVATGRDAELATVLGLIK